MSLESCTDGMDGQSEMEFALELVNHVPPSVADALVERLRQAESAQEKANCRTASAQRRREILQAITPRKRWLCLLFFVLLATSLFVALSQPDAESSVVELQGGCEEQICASTLAELQCVDGKLQEARSEAECGFQLVAIAMSGWVQFIRDFTSGQSVAGSCKEAAAPAFHLLHDVADVLRRQGSHVEADIAWITRMHSELFNGTRGSTDS